MSFHCETIILFFFLMFVPQVLCLGLILWQLFNIVIISAQSHQVHNGKLTLLKENTRVVQYSDSFFILLFLSLTFMTGSNNTMPREAVVETKEVLPLLHWFQTQ